MCKDNTHTHTHTHIYIYIYIYIYKYIYYIDPTDIPEQFNPLIKSYKSLLSQLAEAAEYIDCISAEG